MAKTSEICLITSIAPETRIKVQSAAIQSWQDYGFTIVSLNTREEIEKLVGEFSDIKFVSQPRDGRNITGKPVIYINDIINYLKETSYRLCGIVNSDIYFAPDYQLKDHIEVTATNCMLASPRTDVSCFSKVNGKLDPFGFDAFFFDRAFLPIWDQTQFCLGMPFWDHWFALKPILNSRRVKKFISTGIRHIPHSTDRDHSFFFFNDHFAKLMISYIKNNEVDFGIGFDFSDYEILRAAVLECEKLNDFESSYVQHFEKLAVFFDNLTKYVIRFINDRSEAS